MKKLKIGLSAIHFPVTMARYFWDALDRREDCEVFAVGPFFDDYIPWNYGMTLPRKYVKQPFLPLPQQALKLRMPYEAVVTQMPSDLDLFLVIDAGWHFATRPKAKIVALIETDPHVLKSLYTAPKTYSDYTFCMQGPYMEEGEIYLPYAYDPKVHYYEECEKIYDACLVGLHYPTRNNLVSGLRNRGYKVYYEIGPAYEDYRKLYNQSKIALSWSTLQDMPSRMWEALGMGNLLVANHVPDAEKFIKDGQHYLGFDTLEEGIAKVEWALSHPEEAKGIAYEGYIKVTPHTWDYRCTNILKTCGLL